MVSPKNSPPPAEIWLFVEGGGNTREHQTAIRRGLSTLFGKVLDKRAKPSVIPSGGRAQTFKAWERALRTNPEKISILLIDSEMPIAPDADPWSSLQTRPGDTHWARPTGIASERIFLMVQTMEAWFFADKEALVTYYGKNFDKLSLTQRADIENIPKDSLEKELKHASRNTTKGVYKKSHGFEIIGLVAPVKIRAASPRAAAFFDYIETVCPSR